MNAATAAKSRAPSPSKALSDASVVSFGREICGDLSAGEQREWLVTNGIGGFASGTVAGSLTRRYHGLLFAALKPPLGRTLLVSKLEETALYDGVACELSTNRWAGGSIHPQGYLNMESFHLEGTTPVWTFAFGDAVLEKRIWMVHGKNTTCVRYKLLRGNRPVSLELRALINYRDYHSTTHAGDWRMAIGAAERGLRVVAFDGASPYFLLSENASAEPAHDWYRDFYLAVANYRGLEDLEDHLHGGTFRATLNSGEFVTIVISTESDALADKMQLPENHKSREESLLARFASANTLAAKESPDWIRQLVLAADQFIVKRALADDPDALTIIAGYHWFGDWGRDTMIALPGLALTTGRPEIARNILATFGRFVDRGMLPNLFPDAGSPPEYNTADATLWYFEAIRQYLDATQDEEFLAHMYPVLSDIIEWHLRGTRYGIKVDPTDGLLSAGEPGVQLTWMDAKVDDWVVTPRIGKPVEINALWYNALLTMSRFARDLKRPSTEFESLALRTKESFQKFWNESAGCCFDVIEGPAGNDSSIRPNQIFAVSLPKSPLMDGQRRKVVDTCARHLLTSFGLRSLASSHSDYTGHYGGSPAERDGAYHQGTVWGWLIGPFVQAHLNVYGDPAQALSFLAPFEKHLQVHGLGTASEIFDGDPPFTPRGCIAQAWTVGEILRAWRSCKKVGNSTSS